MMENITTIIKDKCTNATGNIYDIYYALYKDCLLAEHEHPATVLQELLEEVQQHNFEDDQNYNFVTKSEINETSYLYFALLKSYVRSLALQNLNEQDFYEQLYKTLFQSVIFPQDEKKQSILLCLLAENLPEIPYFHMDNLLEMSDDEYKKTTQRLKPQIDKILSILKRDFKSRTEAASQIYETISSLEDRNDKIVLLSIYTGMIQNNIQHQ
mgnify:CR=1 FL=1